MLSDCNPFYAVAALPAAYGLNGESTITVDPYAVSAGAIVRISFQIIFHGPFLRAADFVKRLVPAHCARRNYFYYRQDGKSVS